MKIAYFSGTIRHFRNQKKSGVSSCSGLWDRYWVQYSCMCQLHVFCFVASGRPISRCEMRLAPGFFAFQKWRIATIGCNVTAGPLHFTASFLYTSLSKFIVGTYYFILLSEAESESVEYFSQEHD